MFSISAPSQCRTACRGADCRPRCTSSVNPMTRRRPCASAGPMSRRRNGIRGARPAFDPRRCDRGMSARVADHDVAVIGAGAAGIGAARRLIENGLDIVVLEARERVGGRAVTVPTALGHPVDLGCEWLHSADRNPWTSIARDSGFTIDQSLPDWGARLRRAGATAADQADWAAARDAFYQRMEAAGDATPDRAAAALLP